MLFTVNRHLRSIGSATSHYGTATSSRPTRKHCEKNAATKAHNQKQLTHFTPQISYWNWSLDATPTDSNNTAVFSPAIFSPVTGFGGNGPWAPATPAQNPLNLTGRTGGGCVPSGPFAYPNFRVNVGVPGCLKRDFTPWVLNTFAAASLVEHVVSQPDYAAFARALEGIPSFSAPNIHGSGHFGVGGALGTIGDAANSPGDPLFYLHHANLDRVLWEWQKRDLPARLRDVGGPVVPFDYAGVNVTLGFEVNMGPLAGNASLGELLNTTDGKLCYSYGDW
ncbi:Tyrosinase [Macrophomina phaseolina MS6]|uniref:Tyrosinase n=1 Tax=Macrophomina phaseolina (strain MS6) TaxID=1126212 RepID=K2R6Z6_MACPH|nr:Tyrosinase [Macrophomina phaseolina MS6]